MGSPSLLPMVDKRRIGSMLLLFVVLALGGWMRFTHLDWDGLQHAHPDERYINWVQTTIEWSGSPVSWLHPHRSSLNPYFWPETKNTTGIQVPVAQQRRFAYGHFPLYLTVMLAKGLETVGTMTPGLNHFPVVSDTLNLSDRIEYEHLTLVGRGLSATVDTITILFVYLLGRRLAGVSAGLLAAALMAVTVQHIQQSHFATFDALLTTCVTGALWALVRYAANINLRNIILAGIFVGLAVGTKISAVILVLPVVTVLVWSNKRLYSGQEATGKVYLHGCMLLSVALLTFALTNPFAFIEWRAFQENISLQGAMVRGLVDWPFVAQYRRTVPYLYQIGQQGRWLLGWPLTIAAYSSTVWCLQQWLRRLRARKYGTITGQYSVLFSWALPYFVVTGAFVVKFPRYMMPILPVLIVCAGIAMIAVFQRWQRIGKVLVLLVLLPTCMYALAFLQLYSVSHPWITASEAVYASVTPKARILLEQWDHPLPLDHITDGLRLSRQMYDLHIFDPVALPDDEHKLNELLKVLSMSDFIVIASNRNYGPVGLLMDVYPLTSAYYRALFDGNLGFEVVTAAARFPELAGISIRSDPFLHAGMPWPRDLYPIRPGDLRLGFADESFTVYDHPIVIVYRNTDRLSTTELRNRMLQD